MKLIRRRLKDHFLKPDIIKIPRPEFEEHQNAFNLLISFYSFQLKEIFLILIVIRFISSIGTQCQI